MTTTYPTKINEMRHAWVRVVPKQCCGCALALLAHPLPYRHQIPTHSKPYRPHPWRPGPPYGGKVSRPLRPEGGVLGGSAALRVWIDEQRYEFFESPPQGWCLTIMHFASSLTTRRDRSPHGLARCLGPSTTGHIVPGGASTNGMLGLPRSGETCRAGSQIPRAPDPWASRKPMLRRVQGGRGLPTTPADNMRARPQLVGGVPVRSGRVGGDNLKAVQICHARVTSRRCVRETPLRASLFWFRVPPMDPWSFSLCLFL